MPIHPEAFDRIIWTILVGSMAALGLLIAGAAGLWGRARHRSQLLRAWAESEGLRVDRAWMVGRIHGLPAEFHERPGALLNVHVYRFHGTRPDGRACSGFVRLPAHPGKFASPILTVYDPTGPAGLSGSEEMP